MSLHFSALLLVVAACDGGPSDTDTGEGVPAPRVFSDFVNTTTPYVGDATCIGSDLGTVDPAKQLNATLNGLVIDFQSDDEVPDADVQMWFADDINGTPDVEPVSDASGAFSTSVPTCTPIAYGTSTDPLLELTVDTFEVHQVFGFEEDGVLDGEWVRSVSEVTAKLIPGIIGVDWDRTTGIIAGTAFDCNRAEEGVYGHAQMFIHDSEGATPATGDVFYFSNNLPQAKKDQPDTNPEDGLWVAVNVPVGEWTIEMWGYNGTDYEMLGSTSLTILAGSVNISNIYTGHTDGIAYPDSCLQVM
ncbi:MAG: hypothetical protein EXR71_16190 [Myxococcales bacterium]|nr:hypothetical protein [Myxococcales bacterium]